ncbi:hypothetical protein GCM10022221_45370 [Actinocorallia aurea]
MKDMRKPPEHAWMKGIDGVPEQPRQEERAARDGRGDPAAGVARSARTSGEIPLRVKAESARAQAG